MEDTHPLFVEALQKKSYVEYLCDQLLFGSEKEKKAIVADKAKDLAALEGHIKELEPVCHKRKCR